MIGVRVRQKRNSLILEESYPHIRFTIRQALDDTYAPGEVAHGSRKRRGITLPNERWDSVAGALTLYIPA